MGVDAADEPQIWTVPNIISYVRILVFVPLSLGFIAANYPGWALVALFFTGISDGVDGFLARKLGQTTKLGQELDPVSDRVTIVLVAVAMSLSGLLPWYLFAIIFILDLLMMIIVSMVFDGQPKVKASRVGKLRTALLLLGLPMLLLASTLESQILYEVALVIVYLGVLGQVVAFFGYVKVMFSQAANDAEIAEEPRVVKEG